MGRESRWTAWGLALTVGAVLCLVAPAVSAAATVPLQVQFGPIPQKLTSGDENRGHQIYQKQCEVCHDIDAEGDGPVGGMFIPPPANLTAVRDAPGMARSIVENGLPGTAMPAHTSLSDYEVDSVLRYVQSFPIDTTREWGNAWTLGAQPDLSMAATVFAQACADCHGAKGDGNGTWAKNDAFVWPKPANFHAESSDVGRLYEIISNGLNGTFMAPQAPRFSDEARWALANYVGEILGPKSPDTIVTGSIQTMKNPYTPTQGNIAKAGETAANLYCTYCHGGEVNGTLIAPNLGDRQWFYGGGSDTALFEVIAKGIPGKLMPPHPAIPADLRWRIITYIRNHGGLPDPLSAGSVSAKTGTQTTSSSGVVEAAQLPGDKAGSTPIETAGMALMGMDTFMTDPGNAANSSGSNVTGNGPVVTVNISGLRFSPSYLVIAAGTTVRWVNHDDGPHTATQNDWTLGKNGGRSPSSWNSGVISPGQSWSHTFTEPGADMYFCAIHPYMIGVIAVDPTYGLVFSTAGKGGISAGWWAVIAISIAVAVGLVAAVIVIWLRHRRRTVPA